MKSSRLTPKEENPYNYDGLLHPPEQSIYLPIKESDLIVSSHRWLKIVFIVICISIVTLSLFALFQLIVNRRNVIDWLYFSDNSQVKYFSYTLERNNNENRAVVNTNTTEGLSAFDCKKTKVYISLTDALKEADKVCFLDLSKSNLTKLSPDVAKLINLQVLYLNFNDLKELPPEIGKLNNLISVDLTGNPLTENELGNIKKLLVRPKTKIVFWGLAI